MGIRFSTEDETHRDVIVNDVETLESRSTDPDVEVTWERAPLDLGDIARSIGTEKRQVVPHRDGVAVQRGPLNAIVSVDRIQLGGTDDDPNRLIEGFQSVFGAGLTYVAMKRDRYAIHGAAVARGRDAIVLLGKPGNGKSTTAWAGHQAGLTLLADDTLFAHPDDDGYTVSGLRKPIVLPRDVFDEVPANATQDRVGGGGSRDRWDLPPEAQASGWFRLVGVILPAHGADPVGELASFDQSMLLPVTVGAYYGSDQPIQLRDWFPHAGAISRLPAWQLQLPPDPEGRLDVAARWLNVAFDRALAAADDAPNDG